MFGDILMWVLTVFGLFPLLKVLFGPKKTFQEQLAEFSDDIPDNDSFHDCAGRARLGALDKGIESNESVFPTNALNDTEAARFFQEIGECGDEYRRFSILEDFWDPGNSTRTTRTGPK